MHTTKRAIWHGIENNAADGGPEPAIDAADLVGQ